MTREEAIEYLTILGGIGGITDKEAMALEIAIEALDQEPSSSEIPTGLIDCISRADVNRIICEYRDDAAETGSERDLERAYGANAVGALISELPSVTLQEPILEKINKMKSEIADSLEFWDYSPNNNPLARDMLETITNFWGDMRGEE